MMMLGLKVNVLRCWVDILETNGAFTSTETIWFNRDGNNQPGVSVLYIPNVEMF